MWKRHAECLEAEQPERSHRSNFLQSKKLDGRVDGQVFGRHLIDRKGLEPEPVPRQAHAAAGGARRAPVDHGVAHEQGVLQIDADPLSKGAQSRGVRFARPWPIAPKHAIGGKIPRELQP